MNRGGLSCIILENGLVCAQSWEAPNQKQAKKDKEQTIHYTSLPFEEAAWRPNTEPGP